MEVRGAGPEDAERLREIERVAGQRFREVGLDLVADDEPAPVAELDEYAAAGRSWVAVDGATLVGYVLVDVVDGCAHIEQVTVHPSHQGQGVGRMLVDQVEAWASSTGRAAVTLTTFADVPWNRPLYEHLGFRVLGDDEVGDELRTLRATEAAHGLDPDIRVCMRKDLVARDAVAR